MEGSAPVKVGVQKSHRLNPRLVALIVASASFIQQIDSTIVMTSLPQMAKSLHSDPTQVGIAVSVYMLGLAIFMPVSGWLADRFGAKVVFQTAIAIFTLSSILCAISQNVIEITAARFLQGIGGSMMTPVGRLLVLRLVEKSEFVDAMAWLQVPARLGPVIGLPLGGFITTYTSWRWNFLIHVPIGLLGVLMAAIYIRNEPLEERRPLDWVGLVLSGATLAILLYGLNIVGRPGEPLSTGGLVLAVAIVLGALLVVHSIRHAHPLIDLSLLRIQTFSVNIHAGSLMRCGIDSVPFLLPLLFQLGFGMTAFDSGLLTLASAVGSLSMRAVMKPLLQRVGFRSVLITNGFVTAATIAVCSVYGPSTPVVFIFVTLAIGGSLSSLQVGAMNTIAYADVPPKSISGATSFAGMVQQLANAISIAISVIVLHFVLSLRNGGEPTAADFRITLIVMSCFSLLAIPFFVALPRNAGFEFSGHVVRGTHESDRQTG